MNKKLLSLTIILASLFFSNVLKAQNDKSWVLPFETLAYNAERIEFGDTINKFILQSNISEYPYRFTAGGYDNNGNLLFYMLDYNVYSFHNGVSSFVGSIESNNNNYPAPEVQIIKKPDKDNQYYIIYSITGSGGNQDHQFYFVEVTVNQNPYEVILSDRQFVNTCAEPNWGGFAITREINGKRKMYTCSVCGIMEIEITSEGFSNTPELILENNFVLTESMWAINFEMKTTDDCDTVFAWFTRYLYPAESDTVYIYNLNTDELKKLDINTQSTGRISGIEFSNFEDDIIYVSYNANDNNAKGIYKLNYETGTSELLAQGEQYAHTFLQLAPDGNIYGVTQGNEDNHFFRIDMTDGSFVQNVFNEGFLLSYQGTDEYKIFILPEKTMMLEPINFTVQTENIDCECPDNFGYGAAEINNVQGGCGIVEPYYYTWYDDAGNILLEGEDETQIGGLVEGTYTVTVSDAGIPPATGSVTFEITIDDDLYTYDDLVDIWPGTPDWNNLTTDKFRKGIYVHTGADFTISNSYLQFGPDAEIIVDTGAVLRVDNTTLTGIQQCLCLWKGIEVRGNRDENLYDSTGDLHQGELFLDNSVIEHSKNAVSLWNGVDYTTSGGIVVANHTQFINNELSAKFLKYTKEYNSTFKDCDFIVNNEYLLPHDSFYAFVTLWGVNGIYFEGCRFGNYMTDAENTGYGINALDAGFKVYDYCTNPYISPCPPENTVQSSFENLYLAIKAANTTNTDNTVYVNNTLFNNNSLGIKLDKVNYATILSSEFYIGENKQDNHNCRDLSTEPSYGININNSTGFAIEENYFTKFQDAPNGIYVGIRINETQAKTEVYKNSFEGLSYANYAIGKNWYLNKTSMGLAYYCNENSGNRQDFYVDTLFKKPSGIQNPIGSVKLPAGNTFSQDAFMHINNKGSHWIGYYYYAPTHGDTNTVYFPNTDKIHKVIREEVYLYENSCPSHYGGGDDVGVKTVLSPEQKQQAEQQYETNFAYYNDIKELYESLKDGGNTDNTLSDISNAEPDEMWTLRDELLAKSPHLSYDVLKSVADKTDVFPDAVIFEIMAANPDELRKGKLINYLSTKEHPLPDYMLYVLKQVLSTGLTYKTILIGDLAHYSRLMTNAANDIIRSILNDTVTDNTALHTWLNKTGGKRSDEQLIALYMEEGDYEQALALAYALPDKYNYNENEKKEHVYYTDILNLQILLNEQKRSIFDLDSTEIDGLLDIAENSRETAGTIAKSILEFAYGYRYCDCVNNTDSTGYKSFSVFNNGNYTGDTGITVTAYPNPAKLWVVFEYTLPFNNTAGVIEIRDNTGRIIKNMTVYGTKGQKLWDTRNVAPGIYFYSLSMDGYEKSGKLVISK